MQRKGRLKAMVREMWFHEVALIIPNASFVKCINNGGIIDRLPGHYQSPVW